LLEAPRRIAHRKKSACLAPASSSDATADFDEKRELRVDQRLRYDLVVSRPVVLHHEALRHLVIDDDQILRLEQSLEARHHGDRAGQVDCVALARKIRELLDTAPR
jgi:hypothetical protein